MLLDGRNVKHSKFKPGKVCGPPPPIQALAFFRFALARSRHTDAPRLDGGLEISRVARALVAKSPGPLFCPLPTRPPTVFGEARCQDTKITRPRAQSLIGIPKEGSGLCLNSCPGAILSSLDASCAPCWTLDIFFRVSPSSSRPTIGQPSSIPLCCTEKGVSREPRTPQLPDL